MKKIKIISAGVSFIVLAFLLPIFFVSLEIKMPNYSSTVFDEKNIEIGEIINDNKTRHRYISIDSIPDFTKKAIIQIEDESFYKNSGIDFLSIIRAIKNNIFGEGSLQGASTISSQVIRNSYWLNEKRTYTRKIKEFYLALILNKNYSKDKILEKYLNIINFGNLNYGIESASNYYFGKSIYNLTKAEQLALLTLPQNPNLYSPYKNNESFSKRFSLLANYLHGKGVISEKEKNDILGEKLNFNYEHNNKLPYIIDYLKQNNFGENNNIYTTIDYNLTEKIDEMARNTIFPLSWKDVGDYAIIIVDKKTNEIKVMIGGENYFGENGQVNSTIALRQAGSTIKPFTYTLAFKDLGYTPESTIIDLPIQFDTLEGNTYSPKNYSLDYKGEITMAEALSQSVNIPAIKLTNEIGAKRLHDFLKELGISSLNKDTDYYGLALTLGVGEISLLELTRAYSIFANDGNLCNFTITKSKQNGPCINKIEKKYIDMTNDILTNRYFKLGGFPINSSLDFEDRKVFVKTGTSRNFKDNWSIGYTDNYIIGVWAGNKDGTLMKGVSGSTGAGEIFRNIVYLLEKEKYIPEIVVESKKSENYIEIISPLDKSTYEIDKSKPIEVQEIKLSFDSNLDYDRFKWIINDKEYNSDFFQLIPGTLKFEIVLYNNNEIVGKKASEIEVIN